MATRTSIEWDDDDEPTVEIVVDGTSRVSGVVVAGRRVKALGVVGHNADRFGISKRIACYTGILAFCTVSWYLIITTIIRLVG